MAASYDTVVCTTSFAREEFDRIAAPNVVQVPLGVDLETFHPRLRDARLRAELADGADTLLVHCGRLSAEKQVERSIDAVAALSGQGVRARLVVAGDGRVALQRRAQGLAVSFLGFVPDRRQVATLLASADVSLAPGPHETFGLAALEALAVGTPVVVSRSSALGDVIDDGCGIAAADRAPAFARAVTDLVARPQQAQRRAARSRAEHFSWPASVSGMLDALGG